MRNIQPFIDRDLKEKIVFLSGPRQVGKTHLANAILKKIKGKITIGILQKIANGFFLKNF